MPAIGSAADAGHGVGHPARTFVLSNSGCLHLNAPVIGAFDLFLQVLEGINCWYSCAQRPGSSGAVNTAATMPPEQSIGSADSSSRRRTHSKPTSATSASLNTSAATVTAVLHQGQHDAADAAMYKEMREALADFDSQNNTPNNNFEPYGTREKPRPRDKAFYAALRSVLGQVLQEKTEDARHTRLLAAHQWYVKHKPRPKPRDMDMAAAMAASLSVSCPVNGDATAAGTSAGVTSRGSPSSRQQQQQQQFVLYGKPRQVNSARFAEEKQQQHTAEDEGIPAYNSSRTARYDCRTAVSLAGHPTC